MRFILILTAVLLIGCADSEAKTVKQEIRDSIAEMCIDGVVYIRTGFWDRGYMSVKFGRDSKVVLCEGENSKIQRKINALKKQLK